eukprot:SAG31_NODE_8030_length_1537_cov_1.116134_1_plen_303_part_00
MQLGGAQPIGGKLHASASSGALELSHQTLPKSAPMSLDNAAHLDDRPPWAVESRAISGGVLVNYAVVFSTDGHFFFVVCRDQVRVFRTKTAELLAELQHPQAVTGCAINPLNAFQLLTASIDGIVRTWEFAEATVLQEHDVGCPVIWAAMRGGSGAQRPGFLLHCATKHHYYNGRLKADKDKVTLVWYDIVKQAAHAEKPIYHGQIKSGPGSGSVMSHDSAVVAWLTKRSLCVLPIDSDMQPVGAAPVTGLGTAAKAKTDTVSLRIFEHKKRFTSIAFHPHDYTIATGHENGMVRQLPSLLP